MPYTIWQTSHGINQTVTQAFSEGVKRISETGQGFPLRQVSEFSKATLEPSISYGILRGSGFIMQACRANRKEFWEIDRGYFKPAHFDGYYRVSLNGMNPDYVPSVASDKRWKQLNIPVKPWRESGKHILLCPPTKWVQWFYDIPDSWLHETRMAINRIASKPVIIREKDSAKPLQEDLADCHCVVTHSSNIAIDALVNGIPAIALGKHPVTGWNNLGIKDIEGDLTAANRDELFNFLAWQQFTLDEFKQGWPWEAVQTMQKYKSVYLG